MDKKQKSQQKIISIIAAVIVIAGLGYVFSKAQNPSAVKNNTSSISTTASKNNAGGGSLDAQKSSLSFDGSVIYNEIKEGSTSIYSKTAKDEAKLIFTDKDENDKIKFLGGLTSNGEILAVIAPIEAQFGGTLYLIKTDGSGEKTKIVDEFASPQAPKISPDGRSIAYILFSNTEADYGFSLYIMNSIGQNKIKIDQDSTLLSDIAWSADSQQIAYIKGNNPEMRVAISDIDGKNQNDIFQISEGKTASSLNWVSNNIIFTQNNASGTALSEVLSINPISKKEKIIYKNNQNINQSVWAGKDENIFFVLLGDNNDKESLSKLNIASFDEEMVNLGEASAIIGWQQ